MLPFYLGFDFDFSLKRNGNDGNFLHMMQETRRFSVHARVILSKPVILIFLIALFHIPQFWKANAIFIQITYTNTSIRCDWVLWHTLYTPLIFTCIIEQFKFIEHSEPAMFRYTANIWKRKNTLYHRRAWEHDTDQHTKSDSLHKNKIKYEFRSDSKAHTHIRGW